MDVIICYWTVLWTLSYLFCPYFQFIASSSLGSHHSWNLHSRSPGPDVQLYGCEHKSLHRCLAISTISFLSHTPQVCSLFSRKVCDTRQNLRIYQILHLRSIWEHFHTIEWSFFLILFPYMYQESLLWFDCQVLAWICLLSSHVLIHIQKGVYWTHSSELLRCYFL